MAALAFLLGSMGFAVWSNLKCKKKVNPGGRAWERW